jgi:hypothetical protein
VKITKTQLKEMIHEIMMEISEDETKTIVTKKEKEGPKSATTDIQTNPYEDEDTVDESINRRITVKEIKTWMKTLEENRYKKIVNADVRRVAWLVNNNLSEEYESMPQSIRKKWSKAQYGRERYLAKEFIKSKTSEQKLRESISHIIKTIIR